MKTAINDRLGRAGTSLVSTTMALERSTKADFQATRDANDPAQAMDHFKQWKSGVGQLHEAIDRQLKFCQDLRSNRTLLSLYEDTESEGLRKHVNNLVTQMKVDIRSILKRYPSATAIALPDLDVEELEEELLREAYEHKMSEGKRGGEKGDKKSAATGGEGKTSSNSNNSSDSGEAATGRQRVVVERTKREIHTRRMNALLKSIILPTEGQQHLSITPILSLMTVRSQLISSVVEKSLCEKSELYESFGVELDLDHLRQSEAGEGREMHALHDLLSSFRSVLETVSSCMLMQSYGPVDSIRRLQAERDDLKESLASTMMDLHIVQGDLVAEKNSNGRNAAMSGHGDGLGAASLQVQLRTETRRCKSLEEDLQLQWSLSAAKDDKMQALKERMACVERRMGEELKVYEEKTKWFGPHIDKLEISVDATKRAHATLETDVQLLSIMYKESLRELEESQRKTRDVERERDLMASKLRELLKKLQMSKSEERRKDLIARKTLIARRTALEATALAREEKTSIEGKEKDARSIIVELQGRLKLAEERCSLYASQKSTLEERLSEMGLENEEKKKIIEKLTVEKLQISKVHSAQMKELVMRPAQEEVDAKLAKLRGELEEANMTNEALKEALASSQLGN